MYRQPQDRIKEITVPPRLTISAYSQITPPGGSF